MLSYVVVFLFFVFFLLPTSMQWSQHVSPLSRARTAFPIAAGGRASRASEPLPLHFIPSRSRVSRKQTKVCSSPYSSPHAPSLPFRSSLRVAFVFFPYVRVWRRRGCACVYVFFPAVPRPSLTTTARSCAAAPPLLRPAIKSAPPYFARRRAKESGARGTAEQVQRRTHAHWCFTSSKHQLGVSADLVYFCLFISWYYMRSYFK